MRWDVAIVGAGIVGLAHAYAAARRGLRTVVVERSPIARGASVRNFGLVWPIGQPLGPRRDLALRSRGIWLDLLRDSGLWHAATGSLHLAHHDDEVAVLRELLDVAGEGFRWLEAAEISSVVPHVQTDRLLGGMQSSAEVCVDPRQCLRELPGYLTRAHGVEFRYGCAATAAQSGALVAGGESISARHIFVCSGHDFETLFASFFARAELTRCKLQMMRAASRKGQWRLGSTLSAGASFRHYPIFEACPSVCTLRERFERTMPEYVAHGIHVLVSQHGCGHVLIGDSHHDGLAVDPFCSARVDTLILDYLRSFLDIAGLEIVARWYGVYARHASKPWLHASLDDGVYVTTGLGGAGMTLAFGLGDAVVAHALGSGELPSV